MTAGAGRLPAPDPAAMPGGLVIVDKAGGLTSHDVVARVRRLAGTRRVGHAGTLDPMATGVLVVGVGKATRMLGHLALTTKQYAATIRLGQSTSTDDADGDIVAAHGAAGIPAAAVRAAAEMLTGEILQVPPGVSAIKIGGKRAYQLARAGTAPELRARAVTVHELDVLTVRAAADLVDVDVDITCSSGTYIRAIARDLGAALGTGGHLTALRRTRAGSYRAEDASTLEQLAETFRLIPLADAAAAAFPRIGLAAADAGRLAHGLPVEAGSCVPQRQSRPSGGQGAPVGESAGADSTAGTAEQAAPPEPVAAFGPDGSLIALVTLADGRYRPLAVFAG